MTTYPSSRPFALCWGIGFHCTFNSLNCSLETRKPEGATLGTVKISKLAKWRYWREDTNKRRNLKIKTLKWLPGVPNVQVTPDLYNKIRFIYTWLIEYNLKGHLFLGGGGGVVKVISVHVPKLQGKQINKQTNQVLGHFGNRAKNCRILVQKWLLTKNNNNKWYLIINPRQDFVL